MFRHLVPAELFSVCYSTNITQKKSWLLGKVGKLPWLFFKSDSPIGPRGEVPGPGCHSTGAESGPSSLSPAVSWMSALGVSMGPWEMSSEHLLAVGDTAPGLVSHESELCSEGAEAMVMVVIVVATWELSIGSNLSSSSSLTGVSWISGNIYFFFKE